MFFFASAGTLPKAQATLYKGEGVLLEEHVAWHTRVMKGGVFFANTGLGTSQYVSRRTRQRRSLELRTTGHDWTGQGQDRTGQARTGPDRTGREGMGRGGKGREGKGRDDRPKAQKQP